MLLSTVLLQAAAGVGLSKVRCSTGCRFSSNRCRLGIGKIGGSAMELLHASRKFQVISV